MKKKLLGRKAFTLIELLVVITIIGILASLAIPTIGSAIAKANQTKDLNNITQTGRTLFMDANDNSGVFRINSAAGAPFGNSTDVFQALITDQVLTTASVLAGTGVTVASDPTHILADNVAWDYLAGLRTSSNPNAALLLSYGTGASLTDLSDTNTLNIAGLAEGDSLWGPKCVLAYYVGGNAKIIQPGKDGAATGTVKLVESRINLPAAAVFLKRQ